MTTPREKLFVSALEELELGLESSIREEVQKCESPIEVALLEAITVTHLMGFGDPPSFSSEGFPSTKRLQVEVQKQIGQYRVDFHLSILGLKQELIIECDGHDFHERTKEQAANDRSRDRELTAGGYIVIRFTGSEIWRDPWGCANDIFRQFSSIRARESEVN